MDVPSAHGSRVSDPEPDLLEPARQVRWRVPELALVLSDRAAAQARRSGDAALRLRAESLALFASNRLGRSVAVAGRALAAVRDADASPYVGTALELRVELACCARRAGSYDTAARVLEPVLDRERVDPELRAHALIEHAASLPVHRRAAESVAALDEAERLYAAATDIDRDSALLLRARVHAGRACHHRRHAEPAAATEAAEAGVALLDRLGDATTDSGEVRGLLVLEHVQALLDMGRHGEAVPAAEPFLARPLRAASAGPAGWLGLALATRVHTPGGEHRSAAAQLGEALSGAERHGLVDLQAELNNTLSYLHDRAENPREALRCLRAAYAAERSWRTSVHGARLRLAEEFPGVARSLPGQDAPARQAGRPEHAGETDREEGSDRNGSPVRSGPVVPMQKRKSEATASSARDSGTSPDESAHHAAQRLMASLSRRNADAGTPDERQPEERAGRRRAGRRRAVDDVAHAAEPSTGGRRHRPEPAGAVRRADGEIAGEPAGAAAGDPAQSPEQEIGDHGDRRYGSHGGTGLGPDVPPGDNDVPFPSGDDPSPGRGVLPYPDAFDDEPGSGTTADEPWLDAPADGPGVSAVAEDRTPSGGARARRPAADVPDQAAHPGSPAPDVTTIMPVIPGLAGESGAGESGAGAGSAGTVGWPPVGEDPEVTGHDDEPSASRSRPDEVLTSGSRDDPELPGVEDLPVCGSTGAGEPHFPAASDVSGIEPGPVSPGPGDETPSRRATGKTLAEIRAALSARDGALGGAADTAPSSSQDTDPVDRGASGVTGTARRGARHAEPFGSGGETTDPPLTGRQAAADFLARHRSLLEDLPVISVNDPAEGASVLPFEEHAGAGDAGSASIGVEPAGGGLPDRDIAAEDPSASGDDPDEQPSDEEAPDEAAPAPEHSADVGLADLLAEALVAYRSGRATSAEPDTASPEPPPRPRHSATGSRSRSGDEPAISSTEDGRRRAAGARHRHAAESAADSPQVWTPPVY